MPRVCTICSDPRRVEIDRALAAGQSAQKVAALFRVSDDAVTRHKAAHLSPAVRKAQEAAETEHALDVTKQLRAINGVSLSILEEARRSNNPTIALKAVDRIQRQLELQGRLLGELDDRPVLNVLVSPQWVSIRSALLSALAPFPDARTAVARRLRSLEA